MDKLFSQVGDLVQEVKDYVNIKLETVRLDTAEKSSLIIANGIARLISGIFFLLSVILISIALSLLAGIWLGRPWLGFLIVACFYLLIGICIWAMRHRLIRLPVMNSIIQQLFSKEDED